MYLSGGHSCLIWVWILREKNVSFGQLWYSFLVNLVALSSSIISNVNYREKKTSRIRFFLCLQGQQSFMFQVLIMFRFAFVYTSNTNTKYWYIKWALASHERTTYQKIIKIIELYYFNHFDFSYIFKLHLVWLHYRNFRERSRDQKVCLILLRNRRWIILPSWTFGMKGLNSDYASRYRML